MIFSRRALPPTVHGIQQFPRPSPLYQPLTGLLLWPTVVSDRVHRVKGARTLVKQNVPTVAFSWLWSANFQAGVEKKEYFGSLNERCT